MTHMNKAATPNEKQTNMGFMRNAQKLAEVSTMFARISGQLPHDNHCNNEGGEADGA